MTSKNSRFKPNGEPVKAHDLMLIPSAQNAVAMAGFGNFGEVDLLDLIHGLQDKVNEVHDGSLLSLEAMLYGQAQSLQAIFTNMARRSAGNIGDNRDAVETYMKLALKAQSQCRATLETLAIIKNPQPYIRQANIAHGPQQVNVGAPLPSRTRKIKVQQNKLLEGSNGSTHLDTSATPAPARSNSKLETVGKIHRTKKFGG